MSGGITAGEIAGAVQGELKGDPQRRVGGVAPLEKAGPDELSFVANPRYVSYLQGTRAGVVLVGSDAEEMAPEGVVRIIVEDPHVAMYRALKLLYPPAPRTASIHPTAVIDPSALLGESVAVAAFAVIGPGAKIGDRCSIGAHVVIGESARLGEDCVIHPQATVNDGVVMGDRCIVHSGARVGREGFGFVWVDDGHRRVPQIGGCILGDDVEIGANSTVDRGSIGDTIVAAGTKIDNLVHLAHNVKVGSHTIIIAQVGISGSTTVGEGAVLAGQVGVGGHLTIGAGAKIGGQSGVTADIPAGETYSGYPARPHREAMRAQALAFRLPELLKRVKALEASLAELRPPPTS